MMEYAARHNCKFEVWRICICCILAFDERGWPVLIDLLYILFLYVCHFFLTTFCIYVCCTFYFVLVIVCSFVYCICVLQLFICVVVK